MLVLADKCEWIDPSEIVPIHLPEDCHAACEARSSYCVSGATDHRCDRPPPMPPENPSMLRETRLLLEALEAGGEGRVREALEALKRAHGEL